MQINDETVIHLRNGVSLDNPYAWSQKTWRNNDPKNEYRRLSYYTTDAWNGSISSSISGWNDMICKKNKGDLNNNNPEKFCII